MTPVFPILGYQGTDVPEEYIVKIHDIRPATFIEEEEGTGVYSTSKTKFKKRITIRGLLQDNIDIKTTAQWSPLSAASFSTKIAQEVVGLVAGRALVTKWGTRQVWMGTSPLDFTINLRFEAINDTESEVLAPCRELQRMILPYETGAWGNKTLLAPPGPSAWKEFKSAAGGEVGEIISITIGKLLHMNRVIVRDINISFMNRFEEGGNPIGANAAVHFQTFEVLTKNSLESELYHSTKTMASPAVKKKTWEEFEGVI